MLLSKKELPHKIAAASKERAVFGLTNGGLLQAKQDGLPYLYCDHSYFKRGWDHKNFRLVRNGIHLTRVIPQEGDRLWEVFEVKIQPWRANGNHIVVIQPSPFIEAHFKIEGLAERMAAEVQQYTDRPVFLKVGKDGLQEKLRNAWAVVCPVSVAGVEAAIAGIPVFSTPMCPSWPISAGELKDIENPHTVDLYDWANSLAWSSWNVKEIPYIDYKSYQCA